MVVEAAIDFSNGANRETWTAYRWRMSDDISPWKMGGFNVGARATSEFAAEPDPAETAEPYEGSGLREKKYRPTNDE
jgi:hypothetical protein